MKMTVRIYTSAFCHFCHQTKEFLDKKGVKYGEIDVSDDENAVKRIIEMIGQNGVPVIEIGKNLIVWFDQKRIEEALEL